MKTASDQLSEDPEKLREIIHGLRSAVAEKDGLLAAKDDHIDAWKSKYEQILEQFRLAQQRQFGNSSESADQLGLFNEGEEIDTTAAVDTDAESETITYTRKKPRRKPLPDTLPRETIIHDIEDKSCDCSVMACTGWARRRASSLSSSRRA